MKKFDKLFIIFLIISIAGSFYESFVDIIYSAIYDEFISYKIHRGVIYGPFNVIYGFGAVIMILFIKESYSNLKIFLSGAIMGGSFEYVVSFLQETFTGSTSWDYSNKILNINGRTGITYMIIWGLFTLLFIRKIYPFLSSLIEILPYKKIIIKILVIFMAVNIFISWTAIIRQNLRKNNLPPFTFLGELYDKYYTDEFMEKYFPNMNFKR